MSALDDLRAAGRWFLHIRHTDGRSELVETSPGEAQDVPPGATVSIAADPIVEAHLAAQEQPPEEELAEPLSEPEALEAHRERGTAEASSLNKEALASPALVGDGDVPRESTVTDTFDIEPGETVEAIKQQAAEVAPSEQPSSSVVGSAEPGDQVPMGATADQASTESPTPPPTPRQAPEEPTP